ncbi:hypothetical protein HJC23_003998 [Cyclotella cryptica]|uniref:DDE Tnp4 domain-containing protein n=1 Tax=Cyclotella cryptica TaxID=29204 RepID=A0ABD3QVL5_9STRA
MALRYVSGGDPLDIADLHGVADDEVLNSVWDIIDAIHLTPEMNITFPETYHDQIECAQGFKVKSRMDIDCCVGCIDEMLFWINQPSAKDQKVIGFGPTKVFCGRKKKFGLNMMGVCDSQRRVIWVEVNMPGAASDFYAFDKSVVKQKLKATGFLFPVRINIECSFGILVHRWGILLLDGGVHMDDHTEAQRRQYRHDLDKPCHKILAEVIRMGYERPNYSWERLQAGENEL